MAGAIACFMALAAAAQARQITVPLTIDYITLREGLKRQIYNGPSGRAILWKGDNSCQYLYAENPRFGRAGDAIKLETEGILGLGVPIGGRCVSPVAWHGIIEIDAQPYAAPNLAVMFRVTDINLYDEQHHKTLVVGRGFDLIKRYFIPRFETFRFDLRPAIDEFRSLAVEAAPPADSKRFAQALATIRNIPPVVATDDGVRMNLAITVPAMPVSRPAAVASGPLSKAELADWDQRLDQWDAFVVFAVKQLGSTIADKQVRRRLLTVLLEGRYRLVEAMNKPPAAGGPDPVRILFLDQWRQLRDIVRSAAHNGQLGDHALEFLSFITAGDALMALDEAAPALGMRISAADLRRLARIMAPRTTVDPLRFNYDTDPELQRIFGIVPPPETPDSVGPLKSPAGATDAPASSPTVTPAALSEPAPRDGTSSAARLIKMALRLIGPAQALANADAPPLSGRLRQLGHKLRRAVVNERNAAPYKRDLGELLDAAAASEIADEDPAPALQPTYRLLVRATAWQESCWRQFVVSHGRVRFLQSRTDDIGLMQVNKHVWRGFYSIPHLEWDIAYNAGAGSQILARLMKRAAARPGHDAQGAAVARSTYAGYNGGPDDMDRWRRKNETAYRRKIDEAFWQKYRALREGQSIDILRCVAQWGKTPGH